MSIEQNLERIANALEALVATVNTRTELPVEKRGRPKKVVVPEAGDGVVIEKLPVEEPAVKLTEDNVRSALKEFTKANGLAAAKAMMAKYNAKLIKDLSPADYPALVASLSNGKA